MTSWLILLVVVALLFLLMRKGGMGMGCCGGHSHGSGTEHRDERKKEGP